MKKITLFYVLVLFCVGCACPQRATNVKLDVKIDRIEKAIIKIKATIKNYDSSASYALLLKDTAIINYQNYFFDWQAEIKLNDTINLSLGSILDSRISFPSSCDYFVLAPNQQHEFSFDIDFQKHGCNIHPILSYGLYSVRIFYHDHSSTHCLGIDSLASNIVKYNYTE